MTTSRKNVSVNKNEMALTDNNMIVQTSLKKETWKEFDKILARKKIANIPFADQLKVHCHIPVCVGYDGAISNEELTALIRNLEEKNNESIAYDYTIYIAPREKFGDEENPLSVWQRENVELLQRIPKTKVILENDWRKMDAWKTAEENYNKFRKDPHRDEVVRCKLNEDVNKYCQSHQAQLKQKEMLTETVTETMTETIERHFIYSTIDCLSWMNPKSHSEVNAKIETLNILFYAHSIPQIMHYAFQNADKIGYTQGSLTRLKPQFIETFKHEDKISSNVTVQNASCFDEQDRYLLQQFLRDMMVIQPVDPCFLAKAYATLAHELMKQHSPDITISPQVKHSEPKVSTSGMFSQKKYNSIKPSSTPLNTNRPSNNITI